MTTQAMTPAAKPIKLARSLALGWPKEQTIAAPSRVAIPATRLSKRIIEDIAVSLLWESLCGQAPDYAVLSPSPAAALKRLP